MLLLIYHYENTTHIVWIIKLFDRGKTKRLKIIADNTAIRVL
jgi:hypothetical protein